MYKMKNITKRSRPISSIIIEPVPKQTTIANHIEVNNHNRRISLPQQPPSTQSCPNIRNPSNSNNNNSRANRILDGEIEVQEELQEEKSVSEILKLSFENEFHKKLFLIGMNKFKFFF